MMLAFAEENLCSPPVQHEGIQGIFSALDLPSANTNGLLQGVHWSHHGLYDTCTAWRLE